jgi:hypothetical protein
MSIFKNNPFINTSIEYMVSFASNKFYFSHSSSVPMLHQEKIKVATRSLGSIVRGFF